MAQKHGHRTRKHQTPTYGSWCAMLARCLNPHHSNYPRYGGQVIDSLTQRRTTGEDRRHAVRQLVMAARLAEAELRTLGREGMADTLRAAVKGMRS